MLSEGSEQLIIFCAASIPLSRAVVCCQATGIPDSEHSIEKPKKGKECMCSKALSHFKLLDMDIDSENSFRFTYAQIPFWKGKNPSLHLPAVGK